MIDSLLIAVTLAAAPTPGVASSPQAPQSNPTAYASVVSTDVAQGVEPVDMRSRRSPFAPPSRSPYSPPPRT